MRTKIRSPPSLPLPLLMPPPLGTAATAAATLPSFPHPAVQFRPCIDIHKVSIMLLHRLLFCSRRALAALLLPPLLFFNRSVPTFARRAR